MDVICSCLFSVLYYIYIYITNMFLHFTWADGHEQHDAHGGHFPTLPTMNRSLTRIIMVYDMAIDRQTPKKT